MSLTAIFSITLLLLAALLLFLSINVISMRRKHKERYSHHIDNQQVMAAVSAQRNFVDYVPFSLLLLFYLLELGVNIYLFLLLNIIFVVARYCHAYGILVSEQAQPINMKPRKYGMIFTFLVILIAVLTSLYYSLLG